METKQFKTNIMCGSCIARVTPFLDEILGANSWLVDIKDPKKVLTVSKEGVSEDEVIRALQKAGYKAEGLQ